MYTNSNFANELLYFIQQFEQNFSQFIWKFNILLSVWLTMLLNRDQKSN